MRWRQQRVPIDRPQPASLRRRAVAPWRLRTVSAIRSCEIRSCEIRSSGIQSRETQQPETRQPEIPSPGTRLGGRVRVERRALVRLRSCQAGFRRARKPGRRATRIERRNRIRRRSLAYARTGRGQPNDLQSRGRESNPDGERTFLFPSVAKRASNPGFAMKPHLPALLMMHTENPLVRARRFFRADADERQ